MANPAFLVQVAATAAVAQLAPVAIIDSESSKLAAKRDELFKRSIMFVMQIPAGERHAPNEDLARVHRIVNALVDENVLPLKFKIPDALIGKQTDKTMASVAELQKKLKTKEFDSYSSGHEGKFDALTLAAVQGWVKRRLVEQAATAEAETARALKIDAAENYVAEGNFFLAASIYVEIGDKNEAKNAAREAAKQEKFDEAIRIASELLKDKDMAKTFGAMKLKKERESAKADEARKREQEQAEKMQEGRVFLDAKKGEIDVLKDQKDTDSRQWKDALAKLELAERFLLVLRFENSKKVAADALALAQKAPDKLIDLGEPVAEPRIEPIVVTDEHVKAASGQAYSRLDEADKLLAAKRKEGFDVTALQQRYDQLGVDFDAVKKLKKNTDKKQEFERIAAGVQVVIEEASALVKAEVLVAKSREEALIEIEQRLRSLKTHGTDIEREIYLIMLRLHEQGIIKTKPGKDIDESRESVKELQRMLGAKETGGFVVATGDRLLAWVVNELENERANQAARSQMERLDYEAMEAIKSIPIGDIDVGINTEEYKRAISLVGEARFLKSDTARRYSEAKEKYIEAKEAALAYAAIVSAHKLIQQKTAEVGADALARMPQQLGELLEAYRGVEKMPGHEDRIARYGGIRESTERLIDAAQGIRRIEAREEPAPSVEAGPQRRVQARINARFEPEELQVGTSIEGSITLSCNVPVVDLLNTIRADILHFAVFAETDDGVYALLPNTFTPQPAERVSGGLRHTAELVEGDKKNEGHVAMYVKYETVKNYGDLIKAKREELELSVEDFADQIKEAKDDLEGIESGDFSPPFQLLRKLENELGIKLVETVQVLDVSKKDEGEAFILTTYKKEGNKIILDEAAIISENERRYVIGEFSGKAAQALAKPTGDKSFVGLEDTSCKLDIGPRGYITADSDYERVLWYTNVPRSAVVKTTVKE